MTVTPAAPIASGAPFTVTVAYRGRPRPIGGDGWIRTHDGTTVFSEPDGAPSWFPCNDHPSDKATYSFTVTVPRRYRAIANGLLDSAERRHGSRTFSWHEPEPMATYLATVTIGHFPIKRSTVHGLPAWTAVAPGQGRRSRGALRKLPGIVGFYSSRVRRVPLLERRLDRRPRQERDRARDPDEARRTSALRSPRSSPTRPRTSGSGTPFGGPVAGHLAERGLRHLGHVDVADARRGRRLRRIFHTYYAKRPFGIRGFWKLPPGAPGPKKLFSLAVYYRGGMTLEALREKVGDAAFYATLRDWVAQHRYGNAHHAAVHRPGRGGLGRPARPLLQCLAVHAAQAAPALAPPA